MTRVAPTQVLGLCAVLTLALRHGGVAGDPGVGWHLASGIWMLTHRALPWNDPFLFPPVSSSWIHTQWLSDVILSLVYKGGGWPFLELLTICIGWAICLGIVPRMLERAQVPEPLRMVAVLVAMLLLSVQWFLRPVLFSFLLFAILFDLLSIKKPLPWIRWELPILFMLWANLHPAFVLGLLLVFLKGVSEFAKSRTRDGCKQIVHLLVAGLATLINPYGYRLHQQVFALAGDRYFQNLNTEWLSPDYAQSIFFPHLVAVVLVFAALLKFRRTMGEFEVIAAAVFGVMSLSGARYIPFFAIPAALCVGRAGSLLLSPERYLRFSKIYTPVREQLISGAAIVLLIIFVALNGSFPGRTAEDSSIAAGTRIDFPTFVEKCVDHGARRVFASPDLGGGLIHYGGGSIQPYADDRNELAGQDRYETFFQIIDARPGWSTRLAEIDAQCVVVSESPLLVALSRASGWVQVNPPEPFAVFVSSEQVR